MNREKLIIFEKIPSLETDRLILRKVLPRDSRDMYEYASKPIVSKYLTWYPHENLKFTKNYLSFLQSQYSQDNFYDWAVIYKENCKMIGTCGFTRFDIDNNLAELGYVLNDEYWGRGIAAEALLKVMQFGIVKLNLHRLEVKIMDGNTQSMRVAEKCGFRHEATLSSSMFIKNEYKTIHLYAILADEYIKRI